MRPTAPLAAPHHDGSPRYAATEAPALGEHVEVRVRVPDAAGVDAVTTRWVADGEPEYAAAEVAAREPGVTWWRARVEVANPLTPYRFLLQGPGGYRWLTAAGVVDFDPADATDFRLSAHEPPPTWAGDAVCYQVFPDRFARAGDAPLPDWALPADWEDPVRRGGPEAMRQLYGGDLDGVTARLDHVADLGADVVYLNPVFPAPSNHRYNAASFDEVDPALGGDPALARLLDAAAARGIRVLGDLTPNHCGSTHPWFLTAQADAGSVEAGFFTFERHPDRYATWLGVPTLPKLDHRDPELRRRLFDPDDGIVARWVRAGLSGWRVDVANMTGRQGATDLTREVARDMRAALRAADPEALLIAEHAFDASADLAGDGWHGTMDYAGFTRPVWSWLATTGEVDYLGSPLPLPRFDGGQLVASLTALRAAMPWRSARHNLTLLGSHDTSRFRTVVGGDRARQRVGLGLLMTLPGVPSVFAGDEIGLTGRDNEEARQPMPWDRRRWDHDTLATYRELIGLRRAHVALRRGGLRWAHVGADVVVFLREHPAERLLVAIARSAHEPVDLDARGVGAERASALLDGEDLVAADGRLRLGGDGPRVALWRLEA